MPIQPDIVMGQFIRLTEKSFSIIILFYNIDQQSVQHLVNDTVTENHFIIGLD